MKKLSEFAKIGQEAHYANPGCNYESDILAAIRAILDAAGASYIDDTVKPEVKVRSIAYTETPTVKAWCVSPAPAKEPPITVAFLRRGRNVLMQVLEMPERLRGVGRDGPPIIEHGGLTVVSFDQPFIGFSVVYLRGRHAETDERVASHCFPTESAASDWIARAKGAIKAANVKLGLGDGPKMELAIEKLWDSYVDRHGLTRRPDAQELAIMREGIRIVAGILGVPISDTPRERVVDGWEVVS